MKRTASSSRQPYLEGDLDAPHSPLNEQIGIAIVEDGCAKWPGYESVPLGSSSPWDVYAGGT